MASYDLWKAFSNLLEVFGCISYLPIRVHARERLASVKVSSTLLALGGKASYLILPITVGVALGNLANLFGSRHSSEDPSVLTILNVLSNLVFPEATMAFVYVTYLIAYTPDTFVLLLNGCKKVEAAVTGSGNKYGEKTTMELVAIFGIYIIGACCLGIIPLGTTIVIYVEVDPLKSVASCVFRSGSTAYVAFRSLLLFILLVDVAQGVTFAYGVAQLFLISINNFSSALGSELKRVKGSLHMFRTVDAVLLKYKVIRLWVRYGNVNIYSRVVPLLIAFGSFLIITANYVVVALHSILPIYVYLLAPVLVTVGLLFLIMVVVPTTKVFIHSKDLIDYLKTLPKTKAQTRIVHALRPYAVSMGPFGIFKTTTAPNIGRFIAENSMNALITFRFN